MRHQHADTIVVGGGMAGLAAAIFAARAGLRVRLLERASAVGGLARTTHASGFDLNLGPRALYPPAAGLLDELGVAYPHGRPPLTGYALADGRLHAMSRGVGELPDSPLFDASAGRAAREALAALVAGDPAVSAGTSLAGWAAARGLEGRARDYVFAIVRVAGYIDAPDLLSAAAARAQLIESSAGVRYVDGGWRTIVDGLERAALREGVEIVTGARVTAVRRDDAGVAGVELDGGEHVRAASVVLAVHPAAARDLLAGAGGVIPPTTPVRAAVLDVALSRLPNPDGGFLLALDRPLYLSVHSLAARLAPEGGAVIHVARYLHPDERPEGTAVREELMSLLDAVQPGWRDAVAFERFLPDMTVTHALPAASTGGLAGRPPVAVAGLPGAFVAGDWAGAEHQLAGAALASAKRAAGLAAERARAARVAVEA